jgi:hypothetical protein
MNSGTKEPEECLDFLGKWIKTQKDMIYDENIKSPSNDQNVLANYEAVLEGFAFKIVSAIERENTQSLEALGWPPELMECIRDPNTKIIILNEIEQWLIRFPFVKTRKHLEELEKEYAGINS